MRIDYAPGRSECFLVEYHPGVNYVNLSKLLQNTVPKSAASTMDKLSFNHCLDYISQNGNTSVRYTVFKASGLSATQARQQFGFESMSQRTKKIEDVITHMEYIHTAIDKLVTKEKAVLRNLGLSCSDEESSDDDGENSEL